MGQDRILSSFIVTEIEDPGTCFPLPMIFSLQKSPDIDETRATRGFARQ